MNRATELEAVSPNSQAIVRSEGRRYAGVVVQGDRLGEWVRLARSSDPADQDELRSELEKSLRELIRVSETSGVGVPAGLPQV